MLVTKVSDVVAAEPANAATAKATHMTSAEAAHVTAAKTAHVAAATTTTVSSATATAAAGFRTRRHQAPGKHRACHNHHHSSSHCILHSDGRIFRLRPGPSLARLVNESANVAMDWKWECLIAASTKFSFSHRS
jgi:hypothetical protein